MVTQISPRKRTLDLQEAADFYKSARKSCADVQKKVLYREQPNQGGAGHFWKILLLPIFIHFILKNHLLAAQRTFNAQKTRENMVD